VPVTYVPARNSLFLCLGAAWAEVLGTPHLFIGVNRIDYSGYPDCRPAFVDAMQRALRLGTCRGDLIIETPLLDLSKAEILRRGASLGVDYALTWSCYDPQPAGTGQRACGTCDACLHRRKGFLEAGLPDPTVYA
jgi:7-cyano-7-deazaguanine synthase